MININMNLFKGIDVEHWKPIAGFPDYEVSDKGRVRSFKSGRAKMLKGVMNNSGYLQVCLCNEGKIYRKLIHRLVLEAFSEKPEGKSECNHKNGVKTDNRLENLEWATRSEIVRHAFRTGLNSHKGENHPKSKLTEDEVREIQEKLNAGIPQYAIAYDFGVSRQTIGAIKRGEIWSHVTGINPHSENPEKSTPITINLTFGCLRGRSNED